MKPNLFHVVLTALLIAPSAVDAEPTKHRFAVIGVYDDGTPDTNTTHIVRHVGTWAFDVHVAPSSKPNEGYRTAEKLAEIQCQMGAPQGLKCKAITAWNLSDAIHMSMPTPRAECAVIALGLYEGQDGRYRRWTSVEFAVFNTADEGRNWGERMLKGKEGKHATLKKKWISVSCEVKPAA